MIHQALDVHLDLATQFYDLNRPAVAGDAYEFYRSHAVAADGPILEPMCGTGRFLLPLLEEGLDVHGFDASDRMLAALVAKARLKNLTPRVWVSFAEDLVSEERYGLIFIPGGSFGLITDPLRVRAALEAMHRHLADDGVFVFEVISLDEITRHAGTWRGLAFRRSDGATIVRSRLASVDGDVCALVSKYELIQANAIVGTEVEELRVRLYDDPSSLAGLLEDVGFRDVRTMTAFDRSRAPSPGDDAVVFECRKT